MSFFSLVVSTSMSSGGTILAHHHLHIHPGSRRSKSRPRATSGPLVVREAVTVRHQDPLRWVRSWPCQVTDPSKTAWRTPVPLVETRGTGVLHTVFDGWEPWHGQLRTRRNGSLVVDRHGLLSSSEALMSLQDRGSLLIYWARGVRGDGGGRQAPAPRTWTSTPPRRRSSPTCCSIPLRRAGAAQPSPRALPGAGAEVHRGLTSAPR